MKTSAFIFIPVLFFLCLKGAAQHEVKTLEIGSQAPGFHLPGIDDKTYELKDFDRYPVLVIIFTCNHCPTAQAYENRIIRMVNTYTPKGAGFAVISPNSPAALNLAELGYTDMGDTREEMKIRAQDRGFNFPYLFDGDSQAVALAYGPVATPHVFIFDKDRKLRYTGRIDDTENPYLTVNQPDACLALDAILSGKPVPVEKTKTFGCSIKWAWKDSYTKELYKQWSELPVTLNEIDEAGIREILANNSGKLRMVNIWASWCGPCLIEFPELVKTDRMYRQRDFEFISISADKLAKREKVLELLKGNEASNRNYLFTADNVYKLIEAIDPSWQGALPYTLLVEPGGKVLWGCHGPVDPLELRKKIVGYLGRYYADNK